MPRYAAKTEVSVHQSRAEIESTLIRYGADEFGSGWRTNEAMIHFRLKGYRVRFILPLPSREDVEFTQRWDRRSKRYKTATEKQAADAFEQELRRRWRALMLVVKAKLEAIESNISTIEQEFLAFIVMPNDQTMMGWIADQVLPAINNGQMPMLALPKPENTEEQADAE